MTSINFDYMKDHFEFTEAVKSDILKRWMACTYVKTILKRHAISSDFFAQYFGSKVINYAVGVIEGTNKLGNCPVIGVMLVFFEKKDIPLEDVFTICVNFKNAMIAYALEEGILNHFLLHEICTLIDFNFQGVIHEYLVMHYDSAKVQAACSIESNSFERVTCNTIHSSQMREKTMTALTFAQEIEIEYEILEELNEIEEDTLSSLGLTESISPSAKGEVVDLFTRYTKMIERLMEFQELSYALSVLVDLLEKTDFETLAEESTYVVIYIKAIISDLSVWRSSVFLDMDAEDIHYLDKTLLSSIAQLQILLSPSENADVDDIEFF